MPNRQLIVALKRLADDLREFKRSIARSYRADSRVTSTADRRKIANLAESWISNFAQKPELSRNISPRPMGDLNVLFQRLLIYADHSTTRRKYDSDVNAILRNYTADIVVPLMRVGGEENAAAAHLESDAKEEESDADFKPTAFVGHSFANEDREVVDTFIGTLRALGMEVATGTRPKANSISEKVKRLIEGQHVFIGIFTRRDKLEGKDAWSTSAWVIEEKAYAVAQKRQLILLKEERVDNIGGMQGDYEFIEFSRENISKAVLSLIQLFRFSLQGLDKG